MVLSHNAFHDSPIRPAGDGKDALLEVLVEVLMLVL
jgi:hypothetical protein